MPSQELYLEKTAGSMVFQVLKTYDTAFAKETFTAMDQAALEHLSKSLSIADEIAPEDIPSSPEDMADLIWQEMDDSAREYGQTKSYFVVRRSSGKSDGFVYVSGDWPSAEAFVNGLTAA